MARYANLYWLFLIQRIKIFLEYRVNFLIGASSTFIEHGARLFAMWAVMRQVPSLQGWSLDEILFLYGMVTASRSIEHMFADNLWTVGRHYIRSGDFDRFLVRPVDPLFHVLADRFNQDGVGNLLMGLALIVKASIGLGLSWNALEIGFLIVAILAGGLIFIALNLLTCVSAFWIIDSTPVTLAVFELHEFARYPLPMYGKAVVNVLTWVIPYGLAAYYPTVFLLGRESSWLAFISPVAALVLMFIAYRAWLIGLRHYQGTGS